MMLDPWGWWARRRRIKVQVRKPQVKSNILEQDGRKHERHPRGNVTVRVQYNL